MTSDLTQILKRLSDPRIGLDAALSLCAAAIPNGLFTAMRFHRQTMEVERVYSTLPEAYPVSGRKPKRDTEWGEKVLIQGRPNIGFGPEDIAWAFSDHQKILGLGLHAVLNVPVTRGEQVQGTINFLRHEPAFDAQEVTTGQLLAAALAHWVAFS